MTIDELKALVGNRWDTEWLRSILPQLQAAGVEVQNQDRGDLRPRFRLPDGNVWDFGPGGWMSRGQMGPGFTPPGDEPPGDQPPGDQPPGDQPPGDGGGGAITGFGGGGAITGLPPDNRLTALRNTPGYQFARDEGLQAIQRSAAAKGTLLTGGTLKGLARYGEGIADQLYNETYDRYLRLADLGQRTAVAGF